jgi:hypothetical protein
MRAQSVGWEEGSAGGVSEEEEEGMVSVPSLPLNPSFEL